MKIANHKKQSQTLREALAALLKGTEGEDWKLLEVKFPPPRRVLSRKSNADLDKTVMEFGNGKDITLVIADDSE